MQIRRTAATIAVIAGLTWTLAGERSAVAAAPAQSSYLSDVVISMGTVKKYADESDNYHLTWHSDGNLYGAFGDGWGFAKTAITKRAIGISRITGTPPSLTAVDTWEGDPQGQSCCWLPWNGKSWGMISTGTKLHMWFTIGRPRAMGFIEARIATSSDSGKTWTKAGWAFTPQDKFLMPSFLQVGKAYSSTELPGEIMNYLYSYHTRYVTSPSHVQAPGKVDLVRVPRDQATDRAAYEFFAGTGGGAPIWSKDPNQAEPVLEKPYILDAPPTVAWNPYVKRFIMVMGHVTSNSDANIGVAFYEAEKPWGPWFKIKEQASFAQGTIFFYQFPTKWMNADLSAWMAFTGPDKVGGQEWDSLDVVKVQLVKPTDRAEISKLGCYKDKAGTVVDYSQNDLNGLFFKSNSMTTKLCTDRCQSEGFSYAATRNGYGCFCGDKYGSFGSANTCNVACYGAPSEICGGVGVNTVYQLP